MPPPSLDLSVPCEREVRCSARSGEGEDLFPHMEVRIWTRPGCCGPHSRTGRACLHTHDISHSLTRAALLPWGSRRFPFADDLNASAGLLALVLQLRVEHAPSRIERGLGHPRLDQLEAPHATDDDVLILIDTSSSKTCAGHQPGIGRREKVSSAPALLLHDAAHVAGGAKRPRFFVDSGRTESRVVESYKWHRPMVGMEAAHVRQQRGCDGDDGRGNKPVGRGDSPAVPASGGLRNGAATRSPSF
jgi:hypothetical protein